MMKSRDGFGDVNVAHMLLLTRTLAPYIYRDFALNPEQLRAKQLAEKKARKESKSCGKKVKSFRWRLVGEVAQIL